MGLVALPGGSAADPALIGAQAVADFEQELVDQYALAMSAAGLTDRHIGSTRAIVIEFARSLSTPMWEATCADADDFLAQQRREGAARTRFRWGLGNGTRSPIAHRLTV